MVSDVTTVVSPRPLYRDSIGWAFRVPLVWRSVTRGPIYGKQTKQVRDLRITIMLSYRHGRKVSHPFQPVHAVQL